MKAYTLEINDCAEFNSTQPKNNFSFLEKNSRGGQMTSFEKKNNLKVFLELVLSPPCEIIYLVYIHFVLDMRISFGCVNGLATGT